MSTCNRKDSRIELDEPSFTIPWDRTISNTYNDYLTKERLKQEKKDTLIDFLIGLAFGIFLIYWIWAPLQETL